MSKKRKEYRQPPPEDPNKATFDLDASMEVAALAYVIRETIEQKAIEISSVKKCIPRSDVIKAIKLLGLAEWLKI